MLALDNPEPLPIVLAPRCKLNSGIPVRVNAYAFSSVDEVQFLLRGAAGNASNELLFCLCAGLKLFDIRFVGVGCYCIYVYLTRTARPPLNPVQ